MASVPEVIKNYSPTVVDSWLTQPYMGIPGQVRYHQRNWAGIRAIFVHVQEGTSNGTKQHFRVVTASSTVLINKDGKVERLVPEICAPWTNGDVNLPSQELIAMMNRYGWDPNTWAVTIESEGYSGNLPYTEDQFKSTIWVLHGWKTRHPTIEMIGGHYMVNSVTRPRCPDPYPHPYMKRIHDTFDGPTLPVESPTEVYRPAWVVVDSNGKAWDGLKDLTTVNDKGVKTVWHADKRTITVNVDVLNCRQWANSTANLTRKPLVKGDKVSVLGWVEGEEVGGERRWWVTTYGTRLWVGGTAENPAKAAPKPTKPSDGVSCPDYGNNVESIPVVLNGNTYFITPMRGTKPGITLKFLENGNVRLWAATHSGSPILKTQAEGSTVVAGYWVKGENVTQVINGKKVTSDKWFVIGTGMDAITKGGRVWSGMTIEV